MPIRQIGRETEAGRKPASTSNISPTVLTYELKEAREETDKLFSVVRSGFLYERPVPERHRLIFYLGHVEAFDWNQIARFNLNEKSFHPTFDRLFEAGIDPDNTNALPADLPSDWPSLDEVYEYNRKVRIAVDQMIPRASADVVFTAIEHRLMHAETLAYLLHNMPFAQKCAPALGPPPRGVPARKDKVEIPAGIATLGKERDSEFGWDNEFDMHTVEVPAFVLQKHKVTNGEYLAFVKQGAPAPHFWIQKDGKWYWRGMFSMNPLALDCPVYVTHQQATEYARWKGKKLMTEAQFHRAACGTRRSGEQNYPWGHCAPGPLLGNFNFRHWDPIPVDATPAGDSQFDVAQLVGNGWEWTSTVFGPFEGFRPSPNYPGYSSNFFDGKHYVLKGASPRTAARFLRRSFRNWFRPNYPYVYSTFRCVED